MWRIEAQLLALRAGTQESLYSVALHVRATRD